MATRADELEAQRLRQEHFTEFAMRLVDAKDVDDLLGINEALEAAYGISLPNFVDLAEDIVNHQGLLPSEINEKGE